MAELPMLFLFQLRRVISRNQDFVEFFYGITAKKFSIEVHFIFEMNFKISTWIIFSK